MVDTAQHRVLRRPRRSVVSQSIQEMNGKSSERSPVPQRQSGSDIHRRVDAMLNHDPFARPAILRILLPGRP